MTHCLACNARLEGRRKGTRYCNSDCRKAGFMVRHKVGASLKFWGGYRSRPRRRGLAAR